MTDKNFELKKREIRNGLIALLWEEFSQLRSYVVYVQNGRNGEVTYCGKDVTKNFDVNNAIRDSYRLIEKMQQTPCFDRDELVKYKREYSELSDAISKLHSEDAARQRKGGKK